ncbi:MAG: hypothetical protein D3908_03860, partial [Candidatus Electrothrix sp. AUS4]|nr:hypothetical protein [Candidatus Electrothrix sp. AUS4]
EELDLFSDDFDEDSAFSADEENGEEFSFDDEEMLSADSLSEEDELAGEFDFDGEEGGLDFETEGSLDEDLFADEKEISDQEFALGDDDDGEDGSILPALTDADEDGGFNEELIAAEIDDDKAVELDEKLDSFFEFDTDDTAVADKEEAPAVVESENIVDEQPEPKAVASEEEKKSEQGESEVELDEFFDFSDENLEDENISEEEQARAEAWKDEILAADFDGPDGDDEVLLAGEEDYESFFNFDGDEEDELALDDQGDSDEVSGDALDDETVAVNDEELSFSLDNEPEEQEGLGVIAALSDADEEGGFNEETISFELDEEKAAELDNKLNSFFELDDQGLGDLGDSDSSDNHEAELMEGDVANGEAAAPADALGDESDEMSLELNDNSLELSFDENDEEDEFSGDIAGLSFDEDEEQASPETTDQSDEPRPESEEEIEGLDDFFNLDDEDEGLPEVASSGSDGPEDIPALDDEFVIALDDDDVEDSDVALGFDDDTDTEDSFFDFEETPGEKVASIEKDSSDNGPDDVEPDDNFLSFDEEETSDDEFTDFSFGDKDEQIGGDGSELLEDSSTLDSFFDMDNDKDEEATITDVVDEAENEVAVGENVASSLDDQDAELLLSDEDSDDGFFGFEEEEFETGGENEKSESEDEFALSFDDDASDNDEFGLSFDDVEHVAHSRGSTGEYEATVEDGGSGSDDGFELSFDDDASDNDEFGLSFDDVEHVALSKGSAGHESDDRFLGFTAQPVGEAGAGDEKEESDEEFALSLDEDGSDEDESGEDEFALSFAGEDATAADELSEFSFGDAGEDDAGEDEVVADVAVSEGSGEVYSTDSFFGFEEESLADSESAGLAEESESDDEFALSLDEDESEEDEFALSFGGEDATAADELS